MKSWNFERISLWAAEDILNYIDDLLSKYKQNVILNEGKIINILKFLKLLLMNSNNKDIFSSFDHLSEIIRDSIHFELKIIIIEIYLNFQNSKISLSKLIYIIIVDNYFEFCDCYTFCINLRPIFVEFLLKKYDKIDKIILEYDRILLLILRENKKPELYEKLKFFLPNADNTSISMEAYIKEYHYLKEDKLTSVLYYTLNNYLKLIHYFTSNVYEDMKKSLEFVLNMINLISNSLLN